MKKLFIFTVIFFLSFTFFVNAQSSDKSPDALREQAFADIKTASSLMQRAASAMGNANNQSDLRLSMQLFAEAGKLFQQAAGKLQALVPEYASQQDFEGCLKAMETCMDAINKIKRRLRQL